MNNRTENIALFVNWHKKIMLSVIVLKLLLLPTISSANDEPKRIKLKVYFKEAELNDTLLLNVTHRYFTSGDKTTYYSSINREGAYVFDVPVDFETGYWELRKLEYNSAPNKRSLPKLVRQYFWEAGDEITLNVSSDLKGNSIKSYCKFSGKGASKYNLLFKADSIFWNSREFVKANKDIDYNLFGKNEALMKLISDFIDQDNNDISDIARYLIKVDLFMNQGREISIKTALHLKNNAPVDPKSKDELLKRIRFVFSGSNIIYIDSSKIYSSGIGINFLWHGIKTESIVKFDKVNTKWIYEQINQRYSGILREQIIAFGLQYQRIDGELGIQFYKDILRTVKSEDAIAQLKSVEHFYSNKYLKNYSLTNDKGMLISLNNFKGKMLFIDFWFTGCAACASLYENVLSKVEQHYANDDSIQFVTVSTDRFREKWLEGIKSGLYTSNHAINLYTNGEGNKHPIIVDNKISYQPVAMLIDKKGVIRYFNSDNLYNEKELIKTIQGLQKE